MALDIENAGINLILAWWGLDDIQKRYYIIKYWTYFCDYFFVCLKQLRKVNHFLYIHLIASSPKISFLIFVISK